MKLTGLGVGLYAFHEAARLTGIPVRDLRHWLDGYGYRKKGQRETTTIAPLWEPELVKIGLHGIGFRDLLEVRFVQVFRRLGISLHAIRLVRRKARECLDLPYPFTSRRFQTDGLAIFASALEESGEAALPELAECQCVFKEIAGPSLYEGIEFGANDAATRWYPFPGSRAVVIDPRIAFGKPIVRPGSVKTSILHAAVKAEDGDKHFVARLYAVSVDAVDAAIAFEEQLDS